MQVFRIWIKEIFDKSYYSYFFITTLLLVRVKQNRTFATLLKMTFVLSVITA